MHASEYALPPFLATEVLSHDCVARARVKTKSLVQSQAVLAWGGPPTPSGGLGLGFVQR